MSKPKSEGNNFFRFENKSAMPKEFGIDAIHIAHAKKGYEVHQSELKKFLANEPSNTSS